MTRVSEFIPKPPPPKEPYSPPAFIPDSGPERNTYMEWTAAEVKKRNSLTRQHWKDGIGAFQNQWNIILGNKPDAKDPRAILAGIAVEGATLPLALLGPLLKGVRTGIIAELGKRWSNGKMEDARALFDPANLAGMPSRGPTDLVSLVGLAQRIGSGELGEDGLLEGNKASDQPQTRESPVGEPRQEGKLFQDMNDNIRFLVQQIQKGEGDTDNAKKLLGNLLTARENFYFAVAKNINPDIRKVEGKDNLFQVGDARIYGSVVAILDATTALESHTNLAESLKTQLPSEQVVMGEKLPPKKFLEAVVVSSGSSAQDRIQRYGADIDMAEYIGIEAQDLTEASGMLATAVQNSLQKTIVITDNNQAGLTLHFTEMKLSNYPDEAAIDAQGKELGKDKRIRWSYDDIKRGHIEYQTEDGTKKRLTLQEACQKPGFMKMDYIGVGNDTVVEVTKVSTVEARSADRSEVIERTSKQANAFQEVYFADPTYFGILDDVKNPEKFVTYVGVMADQVKEYRKPDHLNNLKVAKRLYNLLKAEGDLALAQELSNVFSVNSAAIYQVIDRLGMVEEAKKNGIDVTTQKDAMTQKLKSLLQESQRPKATDLLTGLNLNDVSNVDNLRQQAMIMVNEEVQQFFADHQKINQRIMQIEQS